MKETKKQKQKPTFYVTNKQAFYLKALKSAAKSLKGYQESLLGVPFTPTSKFEILKSRLRVSGLVSDPLVVKGPNKYFNMIKNRYDMFHETRAVVPSKHVTPGTAIGVEIECFMPLSRHALKQIAFEDDVKIKDAKCGEDGSVRAVYGYSPYEFRILTNINDFSNLKALVNFLDRNRARVNASCGLHVHLDFRHFDALPLNAANNLKNALPLLKAMVPKGRRENSYCKNELSLSGGAKYSAINASHFDTSKTIEVRLHSGTTNYDKIVNWVQVLYSIAFYNGTLDLGEADAHTYGTELQWSAELTAWVASRVHKFKNLPADKEAITMENAQITDYGIKTFNYEEVA